MGNQSNCKSSCQGLPGNINQICKAPQDQKPSLKPITFQDSITPFQQVQYKKKNEKKTHQKYFDTQNQEFKNQQMSSIDKISNNKQQSTSLNKQVDKKYDCNSPQRRVQFKMEEMVVINAFSDKIEQSKIKYQPMAVPFNVIKISLSKTIIQGINQVDPNFFLKYQNDIQSFKLFKQGFYAHFLNQKYGIFINNNYFYQGEIDSQLEKQVYYPQGKGVFINNIGKYYGQFQKGKANKRGKLFQFKNKTLYEGTWSCGKLIQGNIQNDDFVYEGQIQNNKPHGKGSIIFLQPKINFKGKFIQGKFHDEKGIYQCQKYIYVGGFQNGKKSGEGKLQQKILKTDNKSKIQNNLQNLQGSWCKDQFIVKKKQDVAK